jgi:hypothetical protein
MATQLTPEEINEAIRAYNDALIAANGDLTKVSKTTVEAFNDAKAGIKNYTFQLNQSLKQLGNSVLGLGTQMLKGEQGASVYNKSIEAGAEAIDSFAAKFGFLGKLIGNLITAGAKYVVEVNKQSDSLFKAYQDLSRAGAANAGGITTVYKQMQQFGYNIEELGDLERAIENKQLGIKEEPEEAARLASYASIKPCNVLTLSTVQINVSVLVFRIILYAEVDNHTLASPRESKIIGLVLAVAPVESV